MSYETDARSPTRQALTIVELDLDNPISDAGIERFCDGDVPLAQRFEPFLEKVDYAPTRLQAGLGQRATVTVTLRDFAHYSGRGTYFGRLFGANPYYIGRPLRIYRGFQHSSFSLSNMKTQLYFIRKVEGPDEKGTVKITAADALMLLDGKNAVWPPRTNGVLASALTSSATGSINIGDNTNITNTSYVMIDSEICAVSAVTGSTNITLSSRGAFGTTAVAHDAGAPVRRISHATSTNVVDRIYDLIANRSPIDEATYINWTDWQYQRDTYLALEVVNGTILEPTPVKDSINDLAKQFNIAVFWDDEDQRIRLLALGPTLTSPTKINTENHILDTGHTVVRDQTKAVSQVWVWFGKVDQSKGDEVTNYASCYLYQDPEVESASGIGQSAIEVIFASQLGPSGTASASKTASRISGQLRTGLVEFPFRLDVADATLKVGDSVELTTECYQGEDGANVPVNCIITERVRKETWVEYVAQVTGVEVGNRYGVIAPNSMADYTSATTADRNKYAFISNDSGLMSNGDAGSLIL